MRVRSFVPKAVAVSTFLYTRITRICVPFKAPTVLGTLPGRRCCAATSWQLLRSPNFSNRLASQVEYPTDVALCWQGAGKDSCCWFSVCSRCIWPKFYLNTGSGQCSAVIIMAARARVFVTKLWGDRSTCSSRNLPVLPVLLFIGTRSKAPTRSCGTCGTRSRYSKKRRPAALKIWQSNSECLKTGLANDDPIYIYINDWLWDIVRRMWKSKSNKCMCEKGCENQEMWLHKTRKFSGPLLWVNRGWELGEGRGRRTFDIDNNDNSI